MFDIALSGDKKLERRLVALGAKVSVRIMRSALNRAMTPILKDMRRRCPVRTGALKRSLGKKVVVRRRSGTVWAGIGPRKGWPSEPGNYVRLVEFGTANAPAHPFMRPAMDAGRARAMRQIASIVRAKIEKAAKTGR